MLFLVDESAGVSVAEYLRAQGHDAGSVAESMPQAEDSAILLTAFSQGRIVVTNDKDFGDSSSAAARLMPVCSCFVCKTRAPPTKFASLNPCSSRRANNFQATLWSPPRATFASAAGHDSTGCAPTSRPGASSPTSPTPGPPFRKPSATGRPDLAGVRDAESLAKLPAEEQEAWKQLWAEVAAVLKKAGGKELAIAAPHGTIAQECMREPQ